MIFHLSNINNSLNWDLVRTGQQQQATDLGKLRCNGNTSRTNLWTFGLVILYFILGTFISAHGCWRSYGKPLSQNEERDKFIKGSEENNYEASTPSLESGSENQGFPNSDKTERSIRFIDALMEVVYQICAGATVLTDIVFWCILVPFIMEDNFKLTPVSLFGFDPYSLLWTLYAASAREELAVFQGFSKCIWQVVLSLVSSR
ncbi:hypothetical protein Leryth_022043 [Lithospermum erythrorhizon]|nr:hypothetical protein Leryth_022043 [Lithospermum erythrorhizon]